MAKEENREALPPNPSISSASFSFFGEAESEDVSIEEISAVNDGSPQRISAIDFPNQDQEEDSDNSDDDFEFPSAVRDPTVAAHYPIYPIFGRPLISSPASPELDSAVRLPLRKLLIEERNSSVGSTSSSSSAADTVELEGVPAESYCLWAPGSVPNSPSRCHKSGSTGSLVKWKKISDLVLGRSQSDGKEKFVFLSAKGNAKEEKKEKEKGKKKGKVGKATTEVDTITAHRILYGNKSGAGNTVAGPRKSFLPYKQDLVGLFASVNGISRKHHPF